MVKMIAAYYRKYSAYVPLITLLLGGFLGWLLPFEGPFSPLQPIDIRGHLLYESSKSYQFIDPLLACDIGSESAFPEFAPLKQILTDVIQKKIRSGEAQNISVYLRSLKGARWIEINGDLSYAPASLLKTFVMMAYSKEADATDNPALLDKRIRFEGTTDPNQDDPGEIIPHLVNGQYYSINDIIKQMIIYSDNDALNTLVDNFDPQTLNYFGLIFNDLNIPSPVTQSESSFNFMTVDQYAMVFRVLYGSTYLSERYSEQALSLLSQAHYKGGIVSGVPENITVAHKFGITTSPKTDTSPALNQLHDCGIIYYPQHPYLLCVMTSGNDFAPLQSALGDISAAAYTWLNAYYSSLKK